MKRSTREFLEALSQFCYVNKTPYTFHNKTLKKDQKYRKGVVQVYEWVDELCYFYMQKEKRLYDELLLLIQKRYQEAKALPPSSHREGLLKGFEDIFTWINQIK
ncbi:MAG TPA: hypothetical protein ENK97_03430 [Campylobacteraceae bacterium]|jgi:hypothetical protein|nr:hypothetical protein [Campylobacteraceae bacterium]